MPVFFVPRKERGSTLSTEPQTLPGPQIQLRDPRGRAHGDCGSCEIYHAVLDGSATDSEIDDCKGCYFFGRPSDHRRSVSILLDLARDGKSVSMTDGSRLPATQVLQLIDEVPESRVSVRVSF